MLGYRPAFPSSHGCTALCTSLQPPSVPTAPHQRGGGSVTSAALSHLHCLRQGFMQERLLAPTWWNMDGNATVCFIFNRSFSPAFTGEGAETFAHGVFVKNRLCWHFFFSQTCVAVSLKEWDNTKSISVLLFFLFFFHSSHSSWPLTSNKDAPPLCYRDWFFSLVLTIVLAQKLILISAEQKCFF